MTVIIVTNKMDYHSDAVIEYLSTIGASYFRINTDNLVNDYKFTIDPEKMTFSFHNLLNGKYVNEKTATSLWWRRPEKIQLNITTSKHIENHLDAEYYHCLIGLAAIMNSLKKRVVSFPGFIRSSSNKVYQHLTAKSVGLKTSPTIMTNDAMSVVSFSDQVGSIVAKPLQSSLVVTEDGHEEILLTENIDNHIEKIRSGEISIDAHIFQERATARSEYRVIAFGKNVLPFILNAPIHGSNTVDWRRCDPSLVDIHLFDKFKYGNECIKYLEAMNLSFGAFDFIENDGETIFLECNPNGQFLFCDLQNKYGLLQRFAKFITCEASDV